MKKEYCIKGTKERALRNFEDEWACRLAAMKRERLTGKTTRACKRVRDRFEFMKTSFTRLVTID